MPLQRRLPKRGFNPIFRKTFQTVNISDIQKKAKDCDSVDPGVMKKLDLIKNEKNPVKILGNGEFKLPITVKAHAFSSGAEKKIKDAKGQVEVL
jgi:large subunit ribosomal protein L15